LLRVLYVAQLDPSRKFGSLEEQIYLTARAFQERGGLFLPVFPRPMEPHGLALYRAAGLEYAVIDVSRFRPGSLRALVRLARARRAEVVHWNFYPALGNAYVWALSLLLPWLRHYLTDHNSRPAGGARPPRARWLKRLLLRRYARVVGVSRFVADALGGQGVWPPVDCRLHFINTDRFCPDPAARVGVRRRLGAEGRFVLVAVAYLIKEKGIDVAVRSLARLGGEVVLWVVGDGEEAAALQALADALGVRQRVVFLGLQSQVESYLQAADAFVCPSVWAEAAGLVNVEAQACGLPVLASRVGGIPEYVRDGETGFLFPPGDADGLAAAVRRLQEPGRCAAMGRAARAWAVGRFSPETLLGEYLNLYWSSK
jgi:glycosyltransferase involved in cell wall biosynthesis